MQILKFRYFDKTNGVMRFSDDHASLKTFFSFHERFKNNGHELSDLMQFTGISDQEDKDIYSGDFLNQDGMILEVRYSDFHARFDAGRDQLTKDYGLYSFVAGNIHQNPELLKIKGE